MCFDRVVNDTSAYYVLGYSSTNAARDGRFRRIKVRLKRSDLKLEYRSGYYAPRDFAHSSHEDREQQLDSELASELSATDIAKLAIEQGLMDSYRQVFAALFWFTVLPGPAGAVLYRAVALLADEWRGDGGPDG